MKMVMIAYNEAIDTEVIEALERCGVKYYTKIKGIHGKGATSGMHLGTDVWPGKNNILYVACKEESAKQLFYYVGELRKKLGKEGVKAFVWNLDEVT